VTPHVWRRAPVCVAVFMLLFTHAVYAQRVEPETGRFGTRAEKDLAFPSVGRVISGFVITAIIAGGAALALRRFWPLLSPRTLPSANIRPLSRASVSRTLTVHLVEIDGVRLVMAEGRSAIGITVLPASDRSEPSA
jgi:hypothetical protein